ncbi:MAG: Eco57I restriction-modification methylase domain-containing protein [Candidatus Lokiarchaeota archaeon]|nr:Eco57I restriction-modification methylase domain-containing protein [Candidatus Lokiarchaeota archaeon]
MEKKSLIPNEKAKRRKFGLHFTSIDMFYRYIFPEIKDFLENYLWVDLYAGEGNLILPILNEIPVDQRESFFHNHIYLFDVQKDMVQECIKNARKYGIPKETAERNIKIRDNLENFPQILKHQKYPIFHITNPPYLYLGYIRKHNETQKYLSYFESRNEGYQDLYQIAMINDLRNDVENLIYVIPTNFLYGASVSNKFRLDFLKHYKINKITIFETSMFKFTGTNICISFFKRKAISKDEPQTFEGLKFKDKNKFVKREYNLKPKYKYRAGSEFDEFIEENSTRNPLKVKYYLQKEEVLNNFGSFEIKVIDANKYENNQYRIQIIRVSDALKGKLMNNILYARTVDTGSIDGRAGLGIIKEHFGVDGIYVSGNTYRTHPIQIFLEPELTYEDQLLLRNFFNTILEYFREKLDSEFLTTYKYSKADYTRKFLGLTQVRGLIETFPHELKEENKEKLKSFIKTNEIEKIFKFIKQFKS